MPQLFLVRHAEPATPGIFLGRLDPGLSAGGLAAARQKLAVLEGAVAYVSPLRRAQETAEHLPPSMPRITLPELAEISLGQWEGKTWEEVERGDPPLAKAKAERWFEIAAPGGEAWDQVIARARIILERIRRGPFPAIVVAHQGINSALFATLTGGDPHTYSQGYCEVFAHEF